MRGGKPHRGISEARNHSLQKRLIKKKDIPLDITPDEQGLDDVSIDGDDNINIEETQEVSSNDED